jgi:magnesium chelatase family protein
LRQAAGNIFRARIYLSIENQGVLRMAMSQLNLSARAYQYIQKLARTIAALAGSEEIQTPYLSEALPCRPEVIPGTM